VRCILFPHLFPHLDFGEFRSVNSVLLSAVGVTHHCGVWDFLPWFNWQVVFRHASLFALKSTFR